MQTIPGLFPPTLSALSWAPPSEETLLQAVLLLLEPLKFTGSWVAISYNRLERGREGEREGEGGREGGRGEEREMHV